MIEEQKPVKDLQPVPARPIVSNELQFAAGKLKISGDLEDILDALRRVLPVLPKRLSVEIKFEREREPGYDQ